jgi:hypothetical protein
MKKPKTPPPTKEEVRAAKKVLSRWRKIKGRIRHRRYFIRRKVSPALARYSTWRHDFGVVLEAAVRTSNLSPAEIVEHAERAADMMADAVAARTPGDAEAFLGRYRVRGMGAKRQWFEWQSLFDQLVHNMAPRVDLSAAAIVNRAEEIADVATDVIERRRPKPQQKQKVAA